MRKIIFRVSTLLLVASSLMFTNCIGSFSLTNRVLAWNNQVSSKFVNELVFFAFLVLPVYEVTALADLLVINSIEFWSGSNPVSASVKAIDTEHGRYLVACDGKGYTVTHQDSGNTMRLDFIEDTNSWAMDVNGEKVVFMTFVDDSHVKMITPEGDYRMVELSEQGVLAYASQSALGNMMLASR